MESGVRQPACVYGVVARSVSTCDEIDPSKASYRGCCGAVALVRRMGRDM